MTTHNANNERTKRRYFAYLKEAKRHSEPTVDAVAKALARFESDTKHRDFKSFHFEQAIAFKRRLAEQKSQQTGEKLSKATLHATLANVKAFFIAMRATDTPGIMHWRTSSCLTCGSYRQRPSRLCPTTNPFNTSEFLCIAYVHVVLHGHKRLSIHALAKGRR